MNVLKTIWMWMKRVIFLALMGFSIFSAAMAFGEIEKTALNISLNIGMILIALGSAVLYWFSSSNFSWAVLATTIAQTTISGFLLYKNSGDALLMCLVTNIVGVIFELGFVGVIAVLSFVFSGSSSSSGSRGSGSSSSSSSSSGNSSSSGSSLRNGSEERKKRYKAYCKYCGATTNSSNGYTTPGDAIQNLQISNMGCGQNCHTPVIEEV